MMFRKVGESEVSGDVVEVKEIKKEKKREDEKREEEEEVTQNINPKRKLNK